VLETVAAAGRATAVAGIEAEGPGRVLALACLRQFREQGANRVEGADVAGGIRACGAADAALVHHDHILDQFGSLERAMAARVLGRLALGAQQRRVEYIVHQSRFTRAADAGDAHQAPQRNLDVDLLEIVLGRALNAQPAGAGGRGAPRSAARLLDLLAAEQVIGGQRPLGLGQRAKLAEEYDLTALLAGAGPDVEQAVCGAHDMRIVLDHHQGVAGITQPLHDADDAADVACVQADGGFVQHEQGVDQRGSERRGEIDALYLASRQGARLAVEIQIAQAHIGEVPEARADFPEQQIGGLIERRRQFEGGEKFAAAIDGQQHQLADGEPGIADAPQQRLGLEARAAARGAFGVRAVSRQQHADVHLVGPGLEPGEETPYSIPDILGPLAFTLDHPFALRVAEIAPRHIQRDGALAREFHQVVLAFLV